MLEIGIKIKDDNTVLVYSDYELEQFRKYLENGDHYIKISWYELKIERSSRKIFPTEPKTGYFRKETIQYFAEANKEKLGL